MRQRPKVVITQNRKHKYDLFRLAYNVYCEEMGRQPKSANHKNRLLIDELDTWADHVVGLDESDRVVGTSRSNYPKDGDVGNYREFYELDRLGLENTAVVSRLIVSPDHRSSTLALRMCSLQFEKIYSDGIRWAVCDCNDPVLDFYLRLGMRPHRDRATHPDYGTVSVLKMDLHDPALLDPKKSLLARFFSAEFKSDLQKLAMKGAA